VAVRREHRTDRKNREKGGKRGSSKKAIEKRKSYVIREQNKRKRSACLEFGDAVERGIQGGTNEKTRRVE